MKAVGTVAEYNPFHLGHAWHIARTRSLLGEDKPVVCVMSGSWVQRGECALTHKWARAALALAGGADLVLELPLPWAISSAESFAGGGVALLRATGVVDTLSFGSESGDVDALRETARTLDSEGYAVALRAELDKGNSFAVARQKAAISCLGDRAKVLQNPNDSLGVEYLRSAGESLSAVAIKRKGVSHDSNHAAEGFASASMIRGLIREGKWEEAALWLPGGVASALQAAQTADMAWVERAFLARLRQMEEGDFAALPDGGGEEGLPVRLARAAAKASTLEEFYALAKTKRYAHARIRRLALWAFLGMSAADRPLTGPAYLRVLGMNSRGKALLREMKKTATLPVLTKAAHIKRLDGAAKGLFELECRGTDLYGLCFENVPPKGLDYTMGPVIME